MNIFSCMILYHAGDYDLEFLDERPTESFKKSLQENPTIAYWEIREGFVNGGDSRILCTSP